MTTLVSKPTKKIIETTSFIEQTSSIRFDERQKLFVPVRQVETKRLINQPAMSLDHCTKLNVITHPDGHDLIVNACSDKYALTPLQAILEPFEALLDKHFEFEVKYTHRNFAEFFIDYKLIGETIGSSVDQLCPKLRLCHSYTGCVNFQLVAGVYRFICSNGMVGWAEDGKVTHLKRKHMGGVDVNWIMENLTSTVETLLTKFPQYKKVYEVLNDRMVDNLTERFEICSKATKFPKTFLKEVLERTSYEQRRYDIPNNDWLLYNGMNFVLNHNYKELKMKEENRMVLDQKVSSWFMNN